MNRQIQISQPDTGEAEWLAVREPLLSGWLTAGPKVREFEEHFAERHQVKHAIAVTSATTALHLSMVAADVGPGDEVIVPAFTWVATANVVLYQGAKPVFVDIDPVTFNINHEEINRKLSPRTKVIIPVHLFGLCADMDSIRNIAGDILLVEDAACASGAGYKGKPAGGLGDIGCFSFHPRKSITTGEGGMITTNNDNFAEKIRALRNHGASISEEERHHGSKPYILPDFNMLGYNYRMTDIQAAIGIVQLGKLDKYIDERNYWAQYLCKQLETLDWLKMPETGTDYRHGWQSFVTMVDEAKAPMKRNQLMEYLKNKGIATRPGTHAVHMLNYYRNKFGYSDTDFPNSMNANNFSMAIPLHNKMVKEDFDYLDECLLNVSE